MEFVLRFRIDGTGADRTVIDRPRDDVHRVAGTSLLATTDHTAEIRYTLLTDPGWVTTAVGVSVSGESEDRRLALTVAEGSWSSGDVPLMDLYGAEDVIFDWTPAPHTIPLRRLDLDVGESGSASVLAISYPGHDLERATLHYERTAEYRVTVTRTGADPVDLELTPSGVVAGIPDVWRVARP